jgi:hypothetical protein
MAEDAKEEMLKPSLALENRSFPLISPGLQAGQQACVAATFFAACGSQRDPLALGRQLRMARYGRDATGTTA